MALLQISVDLGKKVACIESKNALNDHQEKLLVALLLFFSYNSESELLLFNLIYQLSCWSITVLSFA